MDERKTIIRELEDKKRADVEARNRLLEGLGEALLNRIGEEESLPENAGGAHGDILSEYRRLQKEIAESADIIRSLEADIQRLKELEEAIAAGEEEKFRLEKDLAGIHVRLGKGMLAMPGSEELPGSLKQQEESLLARIEEQEKRLEELEEREGGILAWLGKSAQTAVSRALLSKNRSTLERVYLAAGEKFLTAASPEVLEGEAARDAENAKELKERLSSITADLSGLKGERRKLGDLFGAEGSPARRIQGLEKRIAFVKEEFPVVYLRFASLATESEGKKILSSILREEDNDVLEKADRLKSGIAERELAIEKIRAAISIDNEKAEIEKIKKAIQNQQQKIAAASGAISDLEKQIAESEQRIAELNEFLQEAK